MWILKNRYNELKANANKYEKSSYCIEKLQKIESGSSDIEFAGDYVLMSYDKYFDMDQNEAFLAMRENELTETHGITDELIKEVDKWKSMYYDERQKRFELIDKLELN